MPKDKKENKSSFKFPKSCKTQEKKIILEAPGWLMFSQSKASFLCHRFTILPFLLALQISEGKPQEMPVTSTELINIQCIFRRRIKKIMTEKLGWVTRFNKSPSYKFQMNSESPTLFVRWVTKVPFVKAKTSQRRKYVTALKSVTANNAFLKIYFLKLQLTLWLGTILKATKVLVAFLLSSENFMTRE